MMSFTFRQAATLLILRTHGQFLTDFPLNFHSPNRVSEDAFTSSQPNHNLRSWKSCGETDYATEKGPALWAGAVVPAKPRMRLNSRVQAGMLVREILRHTENRANERRQTPSLPFPVPSLRLRAGRISGGTAPPGGAYDLIRSIGKLLDGNWEVGDARA